jgi:hypothetical protein
MKRKFARKFGNVINVTKLQRLKVTTGENLNVVLAGFLFHLQDICVILDLLINKKSRNKIQILKFLFFTVLEVNKTNKNRMNIFISLIFVVCDKCWNQDLKDRSNNWCHFVAKKNIFSKALILFLIFANSSLIHMQSSLRIKRFM